MRSTDRTPLALTDASHHDVVATALDAAGDLRRLAGAHDPDLRRDGDEQACEQEDPAAEQQHRLHRRVARPDAVTSPEGRAVVLTARASAARATDSRIRPIAATATLGLVAQQPRQAPGRAADRRQRRDEGGDEGQRQLGEPVEHDRGVSSSGGVPAAGPAWGCRTRAPRTGRRDGPGLRLRSGAPVGNRLPAAPRPGRRELRSRRLRQASYAGGPGSCADVVRRLGAAAGGVAQHGHGRRAERVRTCSKSVGDARTRPRNSRTTPDGSTGGNRCFTTTLLTRSSCFRRQRDAVGHGAHWQAGSRTWAPRPCSRRPGSPRCCATGSPWPQRGPARRSRSRRRGPAHPARRRGPRPQPGRRGRPRDVRLRRAGRPPRRPRRPARPHRGRPAGGHPVQRVGVRRAAAAHPGRRGAAPGD